MSLSIWLSVFDAAAPICRHTGRFSFVIAMTGLTKGM
jgi:hypothetical protein